VVLNNAYFRLSGTSMAAPMVTGAVALMLQKDEDLAPAEVKCRLLASAGEIVFDSNNPAFAYLDVEAAVDSTAGCGADNPPLPMNNALEDAVISSGVNWNSVNWNSVNWNSVNWNSVNWNSVNWNSVNWNSVNWNSVNWNSVNWNSVIWDD
jgi:serine protease AprX